MHRKWIVPLALFCSSSALATEYSVSIGDDHTDFYPSPLRIAVGDSVRFYSYVDVLPTGPHNVVADDGSFRCARFCDNGSGGATPIDGLSVVVTFSVPGVVRYHDEGSSATGIIIVEGTSPFEIGPGITGAWFDPSQSGHGLFAEVLTEGRFYVTWFAFNPSGTEQSWFTGVGTYSGNTATVTEVLQPTGGRWIPNFDPAGVVRNAWGTLTFTFTDCNHGRVEFNSVAGYGNGSMDLTRLTLPAGLACS